MTTQGLSSIGGSGEPFQIKVKGKGSQRSERWTMHRVVNEETDVGTWG